MLTTSLKTSHNIFSDIGLPARDSRVISDTRTITRSDPRGSHGCSGGDKCKVSLHGIAVVGM